MSTHPTPLSPCGTAHAWPGLLREGALVMLACLWLTACGIKGPLERPSDREETDESQAVMPAVPGGRGSDA